ncbi:MAG TPA: hypothetical protein VHG27_07765, partial [Xanthobacteraceae bacterium]|nr:hypothetical protein [Xanthobacteraceae bacterium]
MIGGSLGGLMAALALRGVGCDVDVFERVPQRLEGQGAGLRIVPDMARLLQERAGIDLAEVSTFVSRFRHVGADNRILSEVASPGQFTSWGSLHRALTARFDPDRYHFGDACIAIEQQDDRVLIRFASGRMESADLVVFADGILSTGRRLLASQLELEYAGYVTWRGFVAENDVSNETRDLLADSICYCTIDYSHIGMYPIPDPGNSGSAARHINFVWYRNVASAIGHHGFKVRPAGD